MSSPRYPRRLWGGVLAGLLAVLLVSSSGCGPKPHPVRGKVKMPSETLKRLVAKEGAVQLRLESDKNVRASGILSADGSFEVMTLYQGKVYKGAMPGTYSACLSFEEQPQPTQPNDDAPPVLPPLSKSIVPYRYLTFEGAKWSITVPTQGEVTLEVSPR